MYVHPSNSFHMSQWQIDICKYSICVSATSTVIKLFKLKFSNWWALQTKYCHNDDNMSYETSIYKSLESFYFILKISGLAPYSFDRKSRKFKVDAKCVISMILSLFFWLAVSWITIQSFRSRSSTFGLQSNLLDHLWQSQYVMQYVLACFSVLFNILKSKHIERFLESLHSFDESLINLGWKFKAASFRAFIVVALFLFTAISVAAYITALWIFQPNSEAFNISLFELLTGFVGYTVVTEFYLLLCMQFISSAFLVCTRLKALRRNFRYV